MFGKSEKKRMRIQDRVFGRIEFQSLHGVEMWCSLPSDRKSHMIIVCASSTGPTQAQRDFYEALCMDLVSLEAKCKEFISKHEDPPSNLKDMTIYLVELGNESELANREFTIELSDEDAVEIHGIKFKDGKPSIYWIDD